MELTWHQQSTKSEEVKFTHVTRDKFCKSVNWIFETLKDQEGGHHPLQTVLGPFFDALFQ